MLSGRAAERWVAKATQSHGTLASPSTLSGELELFDTRDCRQKTASRKNFSTPSVQANLHQGRRALDAKTAQDGEVPGYFAYVNSNPLIGSDPQGLARVLGPELLQEGKAIFRESAQDRANWFYCGNRAGSAIIIDVGYVCVTPALVSADLLSPESTQQINCSIDGFGPPSTTNLCGSFRIDPRPSCKVLAIPDANGGLWQRLEQKCDDRLCEGACKTGQSCYGEQLRECNAGIQPSTNGYGGNQCKPIGPVQYDCH
jgi:hypothetical protein